MHKLLINTVLGLCVCCVFGVGDANAFDDDYDTSDPLFMQNSQDVLTKTRLSFVDSTLSLGQYVSVGIIDRLSFGVDVNYQHNFNGIDDGFSAVDFGGVYRLGKASDNAGAIVSDVLMGIQTGGDKVVRNPYFTDYAYYAGLRVGRHWSVLTLAATLKSTWIFENQRGMAYIDFVPQAYVRLASDWRFGADVMFRKSTEPVFDQELVEGKIIKQYGRTQYIGAVGYEFEYKKVQVSARLNVLF